MIWKTLGAVSPEGLVDARLQLHHAAQVVASAGVSLLEPQPDDSHPNLGWVESLGALVGRALPGADAQVGLCVADLSLLLVGRGAELRAKFRLDGRSLGDGYAWLAAELVRAGATLPSGGIVRAAYEIPGHAVASGARFATGSRSDFAELARCFSNGYHTLSDLALRMGGTSLLRCWPHHFDLGALVAVATEPDGSLAKSIGVGLSPGDESYAEPYWYVSPWPYPDSTTLSALEGAGHWHTEGYTAAILTGTELLRGSPVDQRERLCAFLDSAVDIGRRVLST